MARSIVLSNGELCVALDAHGAVRDLYYPHVGQENHLRGHYMHRLGVFVDGRLSWLSDGEWQIDITTEEEALASVIVARHVDLGVDLRITDTIAADKPVFIRRVTVENRFEATREIKLYFGQQFEIQKMHGSDTAYYDPRTKSIIHYKGKRVFLIGAELDGVPFNDFATGRAHFHDREGSHRDAEDGVLSKNPIEHGPADSVIGLYAMYAHGETRQCEYWIAAAQSIAGAQELSAHIKSRHPERMFATAQSEWRTWVRHHERPWHDLEPEHIALFKRSLMYMRAHVDRDGGIIASLDSDMFQYGLDTYSYVWPRDASFCVLGFLEAGDLSIAPRFFEFCKDTMTLDGYFMHKYLPDRSLGSSWHPWIVDGKPQLPIQEDETAIVVYMLYDYIRRTGDMEVLEKYYEPLVERAANFMVSYRNTRTKLPEPSYDLWERKRGTSTFTSSCVYGALNAAAELSRMLGHDANASRYEKTANDVREGILKHLWRDDTGMFYNTILAEGDTTFHDATIDVSSAYGVFLFGVLQPDDVRLVRAFESSARRLSEGVASGGLARFEFDDYYHVPGPSVGNPWIITTLWYGQFLTARAHSKDDMKHVRDIFTWTVRHALPSGVLSEQLDPNTGAQVCAGPLAWSHSTYVHSVIKYLDRCDELAGNEANAHVSRNARQTD